MCGLNLSISGLSLVTSGVKGTEPYGIHNSQGIC